MVAISSEPTTETEAGAADDLLGRRRMDRQLSSLADDHEHLAHLDLLAFCHTHTHDRAGAWRRDFYHRLVRLDLNQWAGPGVPRHPL